MKLHYGLLMACAVISLLVRVFLNYSWRSSFDKRGNAFYVIDIARHVIAGEGYCIKTGVPSIDHEPGYPFFLALGYGLFGYNWFGQYFLQILLSIMSAILIFLLGKDIQNRTVGLVAGIYFLFYPYLFMQSLSTIDTTVFIFLLLLFIYLYQKAVAKSKISLTIISGIILGLLLLTRTSILCFMPFVVIYPFIVHNWKAAVKLSASLLLPFILTITPWLVRNYKLVGSPVIATHGGYGLWQGNNEFTYYYYSRDMSLDVVCRLENAPDVCKKYSPHPIYYGSPQQSLDAYNAYRNAAIEYIKTHPGEFVSLMGLKFIKFWTWEYNPKGEGYTTFNLGLRTLFCAISYIPILLLGFMGIMSSLSRWRMLFLPISLILSYTVAHMITIGYTRVRLPLDPILMIFAGLAGWRIVELISLKIKKQASNGD